MNTTRSEVEFYEDSRGGWLWRVWWITRDPNANYATQERHLIWRRVRKEGGFKERCHAELDALMVGMMMGTDWAEHGPQDNDIRPLIALLAWRLEEKGLTMRGCEPIPEGKIAAVKRTVSVERRDWFGMAMFCCYQAATIYGLWRT